MAKKMYFCGMLMKIRNNRTFGLLFLAVLLTSACNRTEVVPCDDYRQAMRDFVVRISETARAQHPDFIVIPQNGIELVTVGEDADAEDCVVVWIFAAAVVLFIITNHIKFEYEKNLLTLFVIAALLLLFSKVRSAGVIGFQHTRR